VRSHGEKGRSEGQSEKGGIRLLRGNKNRDMKVLDEMVVIRDSTLARLLRSRGPRGAEGGGGKEIKKIRAALKRRGPQFTRKQNEGRGPAD